jgi:hypothetical protein
VTDDAAKLLAAHLLRVERELRELRALAVRVGASRAPLADFPADVRWMVGAYER